ncbi:hypothetical protein AX279_22485 [Pseudomonas sp. J237]|nr:MULTISPECIES: phage major capsid protein [Pseudomonas]OEO23095.1 hypothetical protein AX279_22485 [Pseudomonas sp. J237]
MPLEIVTKAIEQNSQVVSDMKNALNERISEVDNRIMALEQISVRGASAVTESASDLARKIAEHDSLNSLREGSVKSAIIPSNDSISMLRKAVVGDVGSATNDLYSVQPMRSSVIQNDPRRSLRVMDLIPRIPVESNAFEFISLDGFANNADYQLAEGDTKAEQDLPTEVKTVGISTIAVTLPASEQILADAPQLTQFLSGKLLFGVLEKLEREIISSSPGAGKISGLESLATAFIPTAGLNSADAIGEAVTDLSAKGWTAGVIVMNPFDWLKIATMKDNEQNYILGSPRDPSPPNLWGVPVATTPSLTAGTVLVLDPQQIGLLDRMTPRFAIGLVDDQFSRNMLTLRAELRAGLAVFSPSAVLKLTLTV